MKFIGQKSIVQELNIILPEIKEKQTNLNLLFRAPSRYGKTYLALLCLNYLGLDNSSIYIPVKGELEPRFFPDHRFHFIDEIHMLGEPESIYPLMDSGTFTFFLATNEAGSLKEPLVNRCLTFNFVPYSEEEMYDVVKMYIGNKTSDMELIKEIASRCKGNPGLAKLICKRLGFAFLRFGIPKSVAGLQYIMDNFLEIKEGGLNRQDFSYLEYLQKVGGISSLQNIIYGTHIDRDTILRDVEPFLLYTGKIKITSKGRTLC